MQKIKTSVMPSIIALLLAAIVGMPGNAAHAQVSNSALVLYAASGSISSNLKDAVNATVDATKETAAKNSALRNQLVNENSADLQDKEQALADQLDSTLLNLENIQTRIAAKTAETEASGTDASTVDSWLATSSADIITAQDAISLFTSSTVDATSTEQISVMEARRLADAAIDRVNAVHDDLQSALDALTAII